MQYLVVDLEATCWDNARDRGKMEIIEIGAVRLAGGGGSIAGEFQTFIRPVVEPMLSRFCTNLTSIRQQDVDDADYFPIAFQRFIDWAGQDDFVWCSWGDYDLGQFRQDCERHKIPFPEPMEHHINLKKEFARLRNIKPCGMSKALKIAGIPLHGTHHRALDDARNIAMLGMIVLPVLELK